MASLELKSSVDGPVGRAVGVEEAAAWALSHMNDGDAGPAQDSALTASAAAMGTQQKQVHRFIAELQGTEEEACAALKTAVYRCRQGDYAALTRYIALSPVCEELFALAERKKQSDGRTIGTTTLFLVELLGWTLLACVDNRFPSSSATGNAVCRGVLSSSTMFASRCLFSVLNTSRDWALIGALRLLRGLFSFSPRVALQASTAVATWTVTRDTKGATAANDTVEHGWKALSRLLGRRRVTAEGDTVREQGLLLTVAILKAAETNKDLAAQLVLHPMWRPFLSRALAGSGNEGCVVPQRRDQEESGSRDSGAALEKMRQAEVAVLEALGRFLANSKSRKSRLFTDQEFFLPRLSRVVVEATEESVMDAAEALWTAIATNHALWEGDMEGLGAALAAMKPPCDSQTNILVEALSSHKSAVLWHTVADKCSLALAPSPSLRWLAAVSSAVELLDDPTPCGPPYLPACLNRSELTAGLLFSGEGKVLVRSATLGLVSAALKRLTRNNVKDNTDLNVVAGHLPDMQSILNAKPGTTSTSAPYYLAWSQCICAYQTALPGRFLQCKFDWGRALMECHEPVQRAVLLPMTVRVLAGFPLGKSKLAWMRHLVDTAAEEEFCQSLFDTGHFTTYEEARLWGTLPSREEKLWVVAVLQELAQRPLLPVDTWVSDFVKQALTGRPQPPGHSCCVTDVVLRLARSSDASVEDWEHLVEKYDNQSDLLRELRLSQSPREDSPNTGPSPKGGPLATLLARPLNHQLDLTPAAQTPTLVAAVVDELAYEGQFKAALEVLLTSVTASREEVPGLDRVLSKNASLLAAIASIAPDTFRHSLLWLLTPRVLVQICQYRQEIAVETADYLQHKPRKLRRKWGDRRFQRCVLAACCALVVYEKPERASLLAEEFGPVSAELDKVPQGVLPQLPQGLLDLSSLDTATVLAKGDATLNQWWVDMGRLDLLDGALDEDTLQSVLKTTTVPEAVLDEFVKSDRVSASTAVAVASQLARQEVVKDSVSQHWYEKVIPSLSDETLRDEASVLLAVPYTPCEEYSHLLQRLVSLWGMSRSDNDEALLKVILEMACLHELSRKAEYRPDSRIPRAIAKECHRLPVPDILLDNNLSIASSVRSESLDIDAFTVFTAGRLRRADATTTDEDWQNYTPAAELDSLVTEICSGGRALGALVLATSSRDKIVRDLSRGCLGRIVGCLELKVQGRDQSGIRLGFRDAHEVLFLLHAYLNALPESTDEPSPSVLAHAVAQMAAVVVRPESPEYEEVCHGILARPSLDTADIPLWFDLFYSKSVNNCTHHRRWILQILSTATHPDYITPDTVTGPLGKRRVPEALMALTADVTQTDVQLECHALDILLNITTFYSSRPAALVKFVKNHAVIEWCYNLLRDKAHVSNMRSRALKIADILLSRLPIHPTLVGLLDLYFGLADAQSLRALASTTLPRYIRWAPSSLMRELEGVELSPTCVLRILSQRPSDECLLSTAVASMKSLPAITPPDIVKDLEAALLSVSEYCPPQAIAFALMASRCTGLTWKSRIAITSILLHGNRKALIKLPSEALEAMSRLPAVEDLSAWSDDVPDEIVENSETLLRMTMCCV